MEPLSQALRAGQTSRLRTAFAESRVLDSLEAGFEPQVGARAVVLVAHQPNLFMSDLVLSAIIDGSFLGVAGAGAIYAAVDHDALDDARLRTAHLPHFAAADRTLSVSLPWRRHPRNATSLTSILPNWDARRELTAFVEQAFEQLRRSGALAETSGVKDRRRALTHHIATLPIGTYRELLSSLARYFLDFYGLKAEVRSAFDMVVNAQPAIRALHDRHRDITMVLADVAARLHDSGYVSQLADGEAALRSWCLDISSGVRRDLDPGQVVSCPCLAPKVLLDDLLEVAVYGSSHTRAYYGSSEHYFIAEQIASRLDLPFPELSFTSRVSPVLDESARSLAQYLPVGHREKFLAGRFSHVLLYLFQGEAIRDRIKASMPEKRSVG